MTAPGVRLRGWEGRSEEGWAEWMDVPVLELHRELPSTNDRARELARAGAEPLTTVVADAQTRGRGRGGKGWHSPPGAGLWISVLLTGRPDGDPGVLPLAVGVAAAEAVEAEAGGARSGSGPSGSRVRVGLKWPNDLILAGGKVAGVLCESAPVPARVRAVAGIGVNLRRPRGALPEALEGTAAFLEEAAGPVSPPGLARALLTALARWAEPAPERLTGPLRAAWRSRDVLEGGIVECQGGPRGRAVGVGEDGALLVTEAGGPPVRVRTGGVRLVEPKGS